ncbi:MAG TPA: DMT family transporter [Terriglobales bacterium]|nr:DMT family transporter [Terriglobales bacterium]
MRSSDLIAAGLGISSATTWGIGDFAGGLAAKKANVFGVVSLAYFLGFLLMLAGALVSGEHLASANSLSWALAAGVVGGLALSAFYQGLAIGEMGIVAPIAAVLTAALPVLFAAWREGMPAKIHLVGFALAVASLWLVSKTEGTSGRPKGLSLALISGLGFGAYLIFIRMAGNTNLFWPLAVARAGSSFSAAAFAVCSGGFALPRGRSLGLSALAGLFDVSGITLFVIATRYGRLDVTAVLASLYPAITVILAHLILKEELKPHQRWGMMAALVSVVLIAA